MIQKTPFLCRPARFPARFLSGLLLLGSSLVAASVNATTYYVSPVGNDAATGTTLLSAWHSIAKANASLRPGDTVMISPGTYSDAIGPANNGTSTARISYIGSLAVPAAATVANIDIARAYVTVKGVTVAGSVILEYFDESRAARNDSVAFCTVVGSNNFRGAKNCMVAHCTFGGGGYFFADHGLAVRPFVSNSQYDTLRACKFTLGTITWKGFVMDGWTSNCLVDSNQVTGFFGGGTTDVQGRYLYFSFYNTLRDNKWTFEGVPTGGPYVAFAMRDSSVHNVFERDTMLCGVATGSPIVGRLINTGGVSLVGMSGWNRWSGCFYKMQSYVFNQDVLRFCTIENSVFASNGDKAVWFLQDVEDCIIRNNTFYSASASPVRFDGNYRGTGTVITNNIFYSTAVSNCSGGRAMVVHGATKGMVENNNLFYSPSAPSGVDPASMSIFGSGTCNKPGTGSTWYGATGQDGASKFGSPLFVDAAFATFDPHLRSGSPAIGMGTGGGDAGAYPFVPVGPDVTPPSAVSNLGPSQISDQTLVLAWTAPGDDGSTGVAVSYDLRYSTQPITASNFTSAIQVSAEPIPMTAGQLQTYIVTGLVKSTTYYFALKTTDDSNNTSAISNVAQVTTAAVDTMRPAPVTDLGASP